MRLYWSITFRTESRRLVTIIPDDWDVASIASLLAGVPPDVWLRGGGVRLHWSSITFRTGSRLVGHHNT